MFATDNSGIFWGLIGLIIIVFVGIGLSSLTTKRFEFASNTREYQSDIQADAQILAELSAQKSAIENQLLSIDAPRRAIATKTSEIESAIPIRRARIEELKAAVAENQAVVAATAANFTAYREAYRNQVFQEAVGEKLPSLRIRSGREYHSVTIVRVTPAGMEIDHSDGRARISPENLEPTWHDRFQWNPTERLQPRREEPRKSEEPSPVLAQKNHPQTTPPTSRATPKESLPLVADEEVNKLRTELLTWNAKVAQLDSQHSEARMKTAQGGAASVPGSLETWTARAARLNGELERARGAQVRARAKLAMVSPNDPVLHR